MSSYICLGTKSVHNLYILELTLRDIAGDDIRNMGDIRYSHPSILWYKGPFLQTIFLTPFQVSTNAWLLAEITH